MQSKLMKDLIAFERGLLQEGLSDLAVYSELVENFYHKMVLSKSDFGADFDETCIHTNVLLQTARIAAWKAMLFNRAMHRKPRKDVEDQWAEQDNDNF